MALRVIAMASGQERNILIVNGRVPETCDVAFALQGGQGVFPLRTTYAIGVVSYSYGMQKRLCEGFRWKPLA